MRILSTFFALFFVSNVFAQGQDYWQQKVEYQMEIDVNVKDHSYLGSMYLNYHNNSPDTLDKVFFHLYFNAFQPGSMMDVRSRTIEDPDRRVGDRISQLSESEQGYINVKDLRQDGKPLYFQTVGTILEVQLLEKILPGGSTQFMMGWQAQVPVQIRRSGRDNAENVAYSMAQWYPKLCEYDKQGWHANPYIGREFHGVWGDFDVKINIDKEYTVAATGILQNKDEIGHGYSDAEGKVKKGKLNWHFKADNVHDFVWAADDEYIHDILVDGDLELHFFYKDDESIKKNWKDLQPKTRDLFRIVGDKFGEYPHKKYSVIQAGDGGMEYPMATLITGKRKFRSLVGVTVHEVMHSWYQMTLGTNEALYPWMDEGFTSYTSTIIMDELFPPDKEPLNSHFRSYQSYINLVKAGLEEPLSTHADHYNTNRAYGVASYSKGEVFLKQLEYVIGRDALRKTLIRYYNDWKFKHPTDKDFIRVAEKVSGLELDWYLEHFVNSTRTIDYGISKMEAIDRTTEIYIHKIGDMIMPLDVEVTLKDGTKELYHIPLRIMRGEKKEKYKGKRIVAEDWPWTHPGYILSVNYPIDEIDTVEIDPSMRLADIDRDNNYSSGESVPEIFFKGEIGR
ncbi:MAG: M1 family metallopeptidase [Flavobacteriales bacterium]|nr:M1 family metallopeptidase [Flavobacteriales bacterium]